MTITDTQEVTVTRRLIPADRCDRCGAAAYVLASKGKRDLQFCMHHGKENELQLTAQGFIVDHQTDSLFEAKRLTEVEA